MSRAQEGLSEPLLPDVRVYEEPRGDDAPGPVHLVTVESVPRLGAVAHGVSLLGAIVVLSKTILGAGERAFHPC